MRRILIILLTALALATNASAQDHTPDYYDTTVRNHFKHQRWKTGKQILDEGMKDYGYFSVMNELQGWYYYHYKKYKEARYFLYKSLRDDPDNQHSRELLVNVEEETKNYSSAICYINEILEYNPYSIGWWRRKINLFRKQGNHLEADRLLVRLKQIYPKETQVLKDVDYQTEQVLAKQKKENDLEGMAQSLRVLLRSNPNDAERYLQLSNLYLQTGKTAEALEISSQGARLTKSPALAKKYAGILAEQGKYNEAVGFLNEMKKNVHIGGLDGFIQDMNDMIVVSAMNNDPYIVHGKIYESKKDGESLRFLLNTSVARGYDEDALFYIAESRKRGNVDDFKLTYMEFVVQRRSGNTKAANRLLEKLATLQPNNEEINDAVVSLHLDRANASILAQAYEDAIPELEYVQQHSLDPEVQRACSVRLFNCYLQTRDYQRATAQLQTIKSVYSNTRYTLNLVEILKQQGRDAEALNTLEEAYKASTDSAERAAFSYAYEELVYPKIKEMIAGRMIRPAYKLALQAIEICPNSQLLYHQALTTAGTLKRNTEYKDLLATARTKFPEDPYFIIKEASLFAEGGDYQKANDIILPLLDTYVGDSAAINAYVGNCELIAVDMHRAHQYNAALKACDDGLSFQSDNRALLYEKGLIFEDMKMYDSAYFYQSQYVPTLLHVDEFKKRLENLYNKKLKNLVTVSYSHAVNGENNKRTGIADISYTRLTERNHYGFTLGYMGRDGVEDVNNNYDSQEPGGTGLQLQLDWTHIVRPNFSFNLHVAGGTKYYPLVKIGGALQFSNVRLFKNFDLDIEVRADVRLTRKYSKLFRSYWDDSYVPDKTKGETDSTKWFSQFYGWNEAKDLLANVGVRLNKDVGMFSFQLGADLFYMSKHIYYNVGAKAMFIPWDYSRTNVFVLGGAGSAPEVMMLDRTLPGSFDHTNTHVGAGIQYMFNRYITALLSGTWYTLYDINQVVKDRGTHYSSPKTEFAVEQQTKYNNYFYTNVQLILHF